MSYWTVRDVPDPVKQKIKLYAVQKGITLAEALEKIVEIAFSKKKEK